MDIMFQKVVITFVNVQFSPKSLHFCDMDFMFVIWKCTDIGICKSDYHFDHKILLTVNVICQENMKKLRTPFEQGPLLMQICNFWLVRKAFPVTPRENGI